MFARTTTAGRAVLPRRVMLAVLISLAAGLGTLMPAPQAALAASQGAASISAGDGHTCAIESGSAYCWGDQASGDIGNGTAIDFYRAPVAVDTSSALAGKTLTQISAGDDSTCALDSTGAAYCWGDNTNGQLGNDSTNDSSVPVAVDTSGALAGKALTQITIGNGYACALAAGAAYCWGSNAVGELGDNSTNDSSVPVAVDTSGALAGKTLTQITAGEFHTCVLDTAGAAYCWGDNPFGELGDNSNNSSSVPVTVDTKGALTGKTLAQIAVTGEFDTCAVDTAGAAYCWGYNADGELGNGSTNGSIVPVAVDTRSALAGKRLTRVASGDGFHTCALNTGGTAYCWGSNDDGQLGDDSTNDSSVPVAVDTSGVLAHKRLTQITAGYFHTCALDTAGATYCWGYGADGELGDRSLAAQSDTAVLTGPHPPTGVTAAARDTQAIASWISPANLDGGTLTGFTATASPGGETCTANRNTTTCTISGLTNGTSYRITVVAHTTAGDSGASTPATVRPTDEPTGPIALTYHPAECVDVDGNSWADRTPVVIWTCNGSAEQAWTVESDGMLRAIGKCLDIFRDGTASETPVDLRACNGSPSQQWKSVGSTLVNPVSGKCLDDPGFVTTDGTQLDIYTCDGAGNQSWDVP
jgi:alpha-tubulin suppressor-like RCC1 family protein